MFRHAVTLWFALVAANVSAQVSGSLTLVSDYRFRGVSLSHNKPAAQLGAAVSRRLSGVALRRALRVVIVLTGVKVCNGIADCPLWVESGLSHM